MFLAAGILKLANSYGSPRPGLADRFAEKSTTVRWEKRSSSAERTVVMQTSGFTGWAVRGLLGLLDDDAGEFDP